MHPALQGTLYICGGFLHLFDTCTDIWYVYSQEFHSDLLYYLSIAFLVSPSVIFLLGFCYLALADLSSGSCKGFLTKICLGLATALLEPCGFILCTFGCVMIKNKSQKMDFYLIEAAARAAGFVEGVFESLPQLVLQSYNNSENDNWTVFTIISVGLSAGGFLYTCMKLLYAIDRVKYFEERHTNKQVANTDKEDNHPASILAVHDEGYECSEE